MNESLTCFALLKAEVVAEDLNRPTLGENFASSGFFGPC